MGINPPGQPAPAPPPLANVGGDIQPGGAPPPQPMQQAAQVYQSMQRYYQAISTQAQPGLGGLDPSTFDAVRQQLVAQQTQPLFTGALDASGQSTIAKQSLQKPLTMAEIASQAGKLTIKQAVVDPVNQFLDTWKRDWKAGLLETVGGVAVIGGLIGLEAITGGAATPFIFAAGAALVAPGLINAWSNEVTNPSDSNLVQAIANTGTAILTINSPLRAFKGLSSARSLAENGWSVYKGVTTPREMFNLTASHGLRKLLRTDTDITQQMDVLHTAPDRFRQQMLDLHLASEFDTPLGKAITSDHSDVQDLLNMSNMQRALLIQLDAAKAAGNVDETTRVTTELKDFMSRDYAPLHTHVASNHMLLPNDPYGHVPIGEIKGADPVKSKAIFKHRDGILTTLRGLQRGANLQSISDVASLKSGLERQALDRKSGGAQYAAAKMSTQFRALAKEAGIDGRNHNARLETIFQALEDPHQWSQLSPDEQVVGQALRAISNGVSIGELRSRTIANAIAGWMPHKMTVAADPSAGIEDRAASVLGWMRSSIKDPHRTWDVMVDAAGDVSYETESRANMLERYQAQKRAFEEYQKNPEAWKGKTPPRPPKDRLLEGFDLIDYMLGSHTIRMREARYRDAFRQSANVGVSQIRAAYPDLPENLRGAAMEFPQMAEADRPLVVDGTVFRPHGHSGDEAQVAQAHGYFQIARQIGEPTDPHYDPAIYAYGKGKNNIAQKIRDAGATKSFADHQSGVLSALHDVGQRAKNLIMLTPPYHWENVTGRQISWLLSDPSVAGAANKFVNDMMREDPAYINDLSEQFSAAGGRHADHWQVTHDIALRDRETNGQTVWPGIVRTPIGPIAHGYASMEKSFWSNVDKLQLKGFIYARHVLTERGVNPAQIDQLAAHYANNLGGSVNPLYMNQVWGSLRNLLFFAPSYWSTMMSNVLASLPGMSRLSHLLADVHGAELTRLTGLPMKALDYKSRVELMRLQRVMFMTYMATTLTSMDLLNVMFGGRHIWDNAQGRKFDINVDNLHNYGVLGQGASNLLGAGQGAQTMPGGKVKDAYIPGMPFFRQGADILNALGLGHDYGFGHELNDPTFQQVDAGHKAMLLGGALLDGIRQQAAGKVSPVASASYGAATGQDLYTQLAHGSSAPVQGPAPISNLNALLNLVPAGYSLQRAASEAQYIAANLPPDQQQAALAAIPQQVMQQAGRSLLTQYAGLPTMEHLGVETPYVSQDKLMTWEQGRKQIHDALKAQSDLFFSGQQTPVAYQKARHDQLTKMAQLDADTFGKDTPQGSLAATRVQFEQAFGLDQPGLADDQWYQRYEAFQAAWKQQLEGANPIARAKWWENETAQWTDTDYLVWEADHMKKALESSVDGQGGMYIEAYRNYLNSVKPYMSASEYAQAEQADPYYSAYRALLSSLGQTSVMGAFVAAFSGSPSVIIAPVSPADADTLAQETGKTVISSQTAQQMAQQAKQMATDPAVAQAGGELGASGEGQQLEQQAIGAAEAG
jgi:hypothetical protein